MIKVINMIFSILKFLLLLVSFAFTFYIIVAMYNRLEKNIIECIPTMLPFVLLLILFSLNFVLQQKKVINCLFYNITCCLAFAVILVAVYRSFYDQNMVMILKLGYNINFNYFADIIAPMKLMMYLLSAANVFLMLSGIGKKKVKPVEQKVIPQAL